MTDTLKQTGSKDLTASQVDRQNILNNPYVLTELEQASKAQGIEFEDKVLLTKEQVVLFFEVTPRTIEKNLEKFGEELRQNGYEVIRGNRLKEIKEAIEAQGGNETDFGTNTLYLTVFTIAVQS